MSKMEQVDQAVPFEEMSGFGMEGFDFNAAFQGAIHDVATSEELALDEKVLRMETIVSEGTSEVYRDFLDFTALAARMEVACNHDHALQEALKTNETLSGFLDSHRDDDGHGHDGVETRNHKDGEYEIDPKTGRRRKKKKTEEAGSFLESIFRKYRNRTARQAGQFSLFG